MKHLLPRLALVMLALTAAYGVYEFQVTFTPPWVAFVSAAMEVRRWRCGDETNYG